jgi:hypothetical protein
MGLVLLVSSCRSKHYIINDLERFIAEFRLEGIIINR